MNRDRLLKSIGILRPKIQDSVRFRCFTVQKIAIPFFIFEILTNEGAAILKGR